MRDARKQIQAAQEARTTIDLANNRIETALEDLAAAIDELSAIAEADAPVAMAEDVLEEDTSSHARLLDALEDMVAQHCAVGPFRTREGIDYDSMALSANAEAIRLLAAFGRLRVVEESGWRVLAVQTRRETV